MGKTRLRLVALVGNDSYFYLEKSEDERARKILNVLPRYRNWTPVSVLAKEINESTLLTTNTAFKLLASKYAECEICGKREIVAKAPLINIKKEKHNSRNNSRKQKFLRAPIYIRFPHS
jgi:hypothetical protein